MQTDEDKIEVIKHRYLENYKSYSSFCSLLQSLIKNLLEVDKIDYDHIEARVKTPESFNEKISRDGKDYSDPLTEVTDIIGIRIVAYHLEDVDKICKKIVDEFTVDYPNSVDKETALKPNQFGYRSVHYVVSLDDNRKRLSEYALFGKMKAEIQIRTVLQHAWAAIDHKIQYKSAIQIPDKIKRSIYRISALLEVADTEFISSMHAITEAKSEYMSGIDKANFNFDINGESLTLYTYNPKIRHKIDEFFVENTQLNDGKQIPTDNIINFLWNVGVTTIRDLDNILNQKETIIPQLKKIVTRWKAKVDRPTLQLVLTRYNLLRLIVFCSLDLQTKTIVVAQNTFATKLNTVIAEIVEEEKQLTTSST